MCSSRSWQLNAIHPFITSLFHWVSAVIYHNANADSQQKFRLFNTWPCTSCVKIGQHHLLLILFIHESKNPGVPELNLRREQHLHSHERQVVLLPALEPILCLLELVCEEQIQGSHAVLQSQRQVWARAPAEPNQNTESRWEKELNADKITSANK